MEKKLRSIPVILFALIVIWVVVAAIIYQNYRAKVVLQLDGQMTLLANHPWLERLQTHSTLTKSQSVTTLPADFPMVQNGPFFGVLFDQSQVNDDEYIWFINRQPMPSDALMLADVRAKLAGHMGEASSQVIPIEASQSSWRVLLQPMADNQTGFVAILANVDNLLLVHASLLLWLFLLMALLVGISYCIFQWRFKHLKSRWMQLIKKARIDELTGLPNQQQLLRDLDGVKHTNLAFLKIHNFNSILNNYGPAVTDNVIRQVSAVLSNFEHPLLKKPSCYHLQPAVFAILEDQEISYEGIAAITKSLVKSIITTPYQVNEGEYVSVNVTTGAVRQNQDAFMLANMALQEAESKKLQFYLIDEHDSWLPETYKRDLSLTQMVLEGIKEQRIVAYFQPIFSAKSRQVAKYECLARLVDEQGEIQLMPAVFIPLAHRANLYYMITKAMIIHAVSFAGKHAVPVSLNLSVSDINNDRTCEFLFRQIKKSGVGHLLQFELLENEAIIEPDIIIKFIEKLQHYGCKVGLDDLGKGHSNIERLLNLPVDFVKIDRTIMENVLENAEMKHVAQGIIKLAHKKGLEVVAEYCADQQLVNVAIDLEADYLQGFYLGKPAKGLFVPVTDALKVSSMV